MAISWQDSVPFLLSSVAEPAVEAAVAKAQWKKVSHFTCFA